MNHARTLLLATSGMFLAAVGCGGLGNTDQFFASAGSGGQGGSAQVSTSSTSGHTATASSGDASSAGGATAGTGGAGGSGGDPSTSSSASSSSSQSSSSTSVGGGSPTLSCDDLTCPHGGLQACCWDNYGIQDSPQAQCVNGIAANDGCFTDTDEGQTRIECQDGSQCGGLICCGHRNTYVSPDDHSDQRTYYDTVSCQATCDYPNTVLCPAGQDDAPCPMIKNSQGQMVQTHCQQSQLLPDDYWVCATN